MRILPIVALLGLCSCGQLKEMNTNMQESTENLKKNTATVQHSSEVIQKNTEEVARSTANMQITGIVALIALGAAAYIAYVFFKRHRRVLQDIRAIADRLKKD
jgi:beta-lactamase regulating signal transducer with metallopeptidase domain